MTVRASPPDNLLRRIAVRMSFATQQQLSEYSDSKKCARAHAPSLKVFGQVLETIRKEFQS